MTKRKTKLRAALGIAPCGCVQDERCEAHKDPGKFPRFPPIQGKRKTKRRRAREFVVALTCHGKVAEYVNWSNAMRWTRGLYPHDEVIRVREILPRRRSG